MPAGELHEVVGARLRQAGQLYTKKRRMLVEVLAASDQPVTIQQILERDPTIPQSSAYRNVAVLEQAGALHRVVAADDFARYELAQDLTGHHHHHLICLACGDVSDFTLTKDLDAALHKRLDQAARREDFTPADLRLDVLGTCVRCQDA